MVCGTSKGSDQQSDQSICLSLEYSMTVRLLSEHHLEFLSFTGDCTGSYESTLVKMPHCMKITCRGSLMSIILVLFKAFKERFSSSFKVKKGAKIRNRYNQVPHLTQDTNGKVTDSQ